MSSSNPYVELSLDRFVASLAAETPAPAGGSAAALVGAVGAGLASMAFRYAASDPEVGVGAYMIGRAEELDELSELLLELVDRDPAAYSAMIARSGGDIGAFEKASILALEAPIETAEFSLAALRLLSAGIGEVPERLTSDAIVAGRSLVAAIEGALSVAAANLRVRPAGAARDEYELTLAALRADAERLNLELRSQSVPEECE